MGLARRNLFVSPHHFQSFSRKDDADSHKDPRVQTAVRWESGLLEGKITTLVDHHHHDEELNCAHTRDLPDCHQREGWKLDANLGAYGVAKNEMSVEDISTPHDPAWFSYVEIE